MLWKSHLSRQRIFQGPWIKPLQRRNRECGEALGQVRRTLRRLRRKMRYDTKLRLLSFISNHPYSCLIAFCFISSTSSNILRLLSLNLRSKFYKRRFLKFQAPLPILTELSEILNDCSAHTFHVFKCSKRRRPVRTRIAVNWNTASLDLLNDSFICVSLTEPLL